MAKPVSQSRTQWVKKGDIVNGKKVEKGYLAQKGKPAKKVTARVNIVTDTESGKKAGETYRYKTGRTANKVKPKATTAGGGRLPGQRPTPTSTTSTSTVTPNAPTGPNAPKMKYSTASTQAAARAQRAGSVPTNVRQRPGVKPTAPTSTTSGGSGGGVRGRSYATGSMDKRKARIAAMVKAERKASLSAAAFGKPPSDMPKLEKITTRPGRRRGEFVSVKGVVHVWDGSKWLRSNKRTGR
jgi:hypothetical protein